MDRSLAVLVAAVFCIAVVNADHINVEDHETRLEDHGEIALPKVPPVTHAEHVQRRKRDEDRRPIISPPFSKRAPAICRWKEGGAERSCNCSVARGSGVGQCIQDALDKTVERITCDADQPCQYTELGLDGECIMRPEGDGQGPLIGTCKPSCGALKLMNACNVTALGGRPWPTDFLRKDCTCGEQEKEAVAILGSNGQPVHYHIQQCDSGDMDETDACGVTEPYPYDMEPPRRTSEHAPPQTPTARAAHRDRPVRLCTVDRGDGQTYVCDCIHMQGSGGGMCLDEAVTEERAPCHLQKLMAACGVVPHDGVPDWPFDRNLCEHCGYVSETVNVNGYKYDVRLCVRRPGDEPMPRDDDCPLTVPAPRRPPPSTAPPPPPPSTAPPPPPPSTVMTPQTSPVHPTNTPTSTERPIRGPGRRGGDGGVRRQNPR